MTPMELYRDRGLWRSVYGPKPIVLSWQVRPYRREVIGPGVTLYTADRSARTLIIGFSGRAGRLFLPLALVLQALDHRRYDLLIVADTRHLHFDTGIEGYADSLPDLARRLSDLASTRKYGSVITYGTSMGGLVALRMGQLMKADRAIAAGGRFAWNVGRLLRRQAHVQAFDLLCHCRQGGTTESYAIFSDGDATDADSANRLAAMYPDCRLIPLPTDEHNFPFVIKKTRKLEEYHRELFDLDRKPDPARMKLLLNRRSKLDPRRTLYIRL